MPSMPFHLCQPGCSELVRGPGKCPKHRAQRWQRQDERRGTAAQRGYDQGWRDFVAAFRLGLGLDATDPEFASKLLARNRCADCWAEGWDNRDALEYDHITPLDCGGARLDPANVTPRCHRHHALKTARDKRREGIKG